MGVLLGDQSIQLDLIGGGSCQQDSTSGVELVSCTTSEWIDRWSSPGLDWTMANLVEMQCRAMEG